MARRLQTTIVDLVLSDREFELRTGDEVGALPRSPDDDALTWELASSARLVGDAAFGAAWETRAPLEFMGARATLPATAGVYPADLVERTCRTPTLAAEGVRAYQALELFFDEPLDPDGDPSGATVRFRVWNGAAELWWDGADWDTPGAGDWNTAAELQSNIADLAPTTRELAVVALLATTDPAYTPSFFGARLAYGCREVGDLDDALTRTVLASLQDELVDVTGVAEFTVAAGATLSIGGEQLFDVRGVQAVFDLTADPGETTELDGTFTVGDVDANPPEAATWEPDDPFVAGRVIRCEFAYAPHVVVSQHRDIEELDRLPAVYLSPNGAPTRLASQGEVLVRDLYGDPPTAVALPAGELLEQRLELRVIAELANDVHRLSRALRQWFGGQGGRTLVSPESGRAVHVREIEPLQTTTGLLAQGVQEARGAWVLTYRATGLDTASARTLVGEAGVSITITDGS